MMKNKKLFWVFIPARSKSKSIKNKNIKLIKGKPLLAYSINTARKLTQIDKIVVSSDSPRYLNIAKKYGCNFLHLRSNSLSRDKTTDFEVFHDFLEYLKKKKLHLLNFLFTLDQQLP